MYVYGVHKTSRDIYLRAIGDGCCNSRKQATSHALGRTHLVPLLGSTLTALLKIETVRPLSKLLRTAHNPLSNTRNVVASAPEWKGTLRQGNLVALKA